MSLYNDDNSQLLASRNYDAYMMIDTLIWSVDRNCQRCGITVKRVSASYADFCVSMKKKLESIGGKGCHGDEHENVLRNQKSG